MSVVSEPCSLQQPFPDTLKRCFFGGLHADPDFNRCHILSDLQTDAVDLFRAFFVVAHKRKDDILPDPIALRPIEK